MIVRARKPFLRSALALLVVIVVVPAGAEAKKPAPLKAGVGRADITPPTGYALGGWTRADRIGTGVHTRLQASAVVLKSGKRKIALVAVDLFAAPGGLIAEAAKRARHGFSQKNVIVSASHTHSGPSQFANFATLNTLAPSAEHDHRPDHVHRVLAAAPGRAADLHLPRQADLEGAAPGQSRPRPGGGRLGHDTARRRHRQPQRRGPPRRPRRDPRVRPGQRRRGPRRASRTRSIRWSACCASIASRPTAAARRWAAGPRSPTTARSTPPSTRSTPRTTTAPRCARSRRRIRRAGRVPKRSPVIGVFGNSNEGDQSAGLNGQSPLIAERVGRARGQVDVQGLAQGGQAAQDQADRRPALDPDLLLRPSRPRTGASPTSRWPAFPSSPAPRRTAVRCSTLTEPAVRGPALCRSRASSRRVTRSGSPVRRSKENYPERGAAVRRSHRRAPDRDDARRGDGRGRSPCARAGARGLARDRRSRRHGQRPRQRVHPVHHHSRGVRPPALRGRLDVLRAGAVGGDHRLARATGRGDAKAASPLRRRRPSTLETGSSRQESRSARAQRPPPPWASRSRRRRARRWRFSGRAARRGSISGSTSASSRSSGAEPSAGVASPTTSAWRSCGRSTTPASMTLTGRCRARRARAATGSRSAPTAIACARSRFAVDPAAPAAELDPNHPATLFAPITNR